MHSSTKLTSTVLLLAAAINAQAYGLSPYQQIPLGSPAQGVAVADVTGDGLADLIAVSARYIGSADDHKLFVFPQQADGSLGAPIKQSYLLSGFSFEATVATADVNDDGRVDVVVGHEQGLSVLTQQVDGSLQLSATVPGIRVFGLSLADFTLDGNIDVAAVHNSEGFTLFVGDGSGGFASSAPIPTNLGGRNDIEAGDVNADGSVDLVAMSGQSYAIPDLSLHLNDGNGNLSAASSYEMGGDRLANGVGVGDINGDGLNDVAISENGNSPSYLRLFMQEAGALNPDPILVPSYQIGGPVEIHDMDGDGRNDVVVAHSNSSQVGIYLQTEGGGLTAETLYPIPGAPIDPDSMAIGDINSDGCPDALLAADYRGIVMLRGQDCVADITPHAFSFTDVNGVVRNSVTESEAIVVAGVNASTLILVDNGEYRVNGGAYVSTPGSVVAGDAIQVRHTSASDFVTATQTTLTIGDISGTFTTTTEAANFVPDAFIFTDQSGLATNVLATSAPVTISGINVPSTISISSGTGSYSINGGPFTSGAGQVVAGDQIRVRLTTASTASTTRFVTLMVGGVSDTFGAGTGGTDSTPNAFAFSDVFGAKRNKAVISNTITVSGINTAVAISVSGGGAVKYSKNGAAFTSTAGTVVNGDQIRLQLTASPGTSTRIDATATIGGISDTWSVTSAVH